LLQFEKLAKDDISGKDAFTLFSTYGLPFEITKELAEEKGCFPNWKGSIKIHKNLCSGDQDSFRY